MRWPLQPLQPLQQTQLQPPFGQSVDSLCHPWFKTTNLSYRLPILKLPPPPCAVLLVYSTPARCAWLQPSCPACFVKKQPYSCRCYYDSCIREPPYLRIAGNSWQDVVPKWKLVSGERRSGYHRWMLSFFQAPAITRYYQRKCCQGFVNIRVYSEPTYDGRSRMHARVKHILICANLMIQLGLDQNCVLNTIFWTMNSHKIPAIYLSITSLTSLDETRKPVRQRPWFRQTGYCTWFRCDCLNSSPLYLQQILSEPWILGYRLVGETNISKVQWPCVTYPVDLLGGFIMALQVAGSSCIANMSHYSGPDESLHRYTEMNFWWEFYCTIAHWNIWNHRI